MARPIENAGGDRRHRHALGFGQRTDIVGRRGIEIDEAGRKSGADGDLVHVDVRRVQKPALLGDGNAGERIGLVLGAHRSAFERVDGDIHARPFARTHLFTDVEHRRLVALALADHDRAVNRQLVELRTHGVHSGLIGGALVAVAPLAGGGHGRAFGNPNNLQG